MCVCVGSQIPTTLLWQLKCNKSASHAAHSCRLLSTFAICNLNATNAHTHAQAHCHSVVHRCWQLGRQLVACESAKWYADEQMIESK